MWLRYPRQSLVFVGATAALVLVIASLSGKSRNLLQTTTSSSTLDTGAPPLSDDELQVLLDTIRGQDDRLFRWDATKETKQRRRNGGCVQLPEAVSMLVRTKSSSHSKTLAAEFLTFCITDAPNQRAQFSQQQNIHRAVVKMVASKDPAESAAACHLIYIASFANAINHQTFIEQGATLALANVILDPYAMQYQIMWAAAALQNLAASYCDTENDGRCYWRWNNQQDHVVLQTPPMLSDGTRVRQEMLTTEGLVGRLIALSCTGPVHGKPSVNNIFPGENAVVGRDEQNEHLVSWAATGTLKNLALEPSAKRVLTPDALTCACFLKDSPDWLESLKSKDFLRFMRRGGDPCWFEKDRLFCLDDNFLDEEGYNCGDYVKATQEECQAKDVMTGIPAKSACCGCGGGTAPSKNLP